MGVVLLHGGEWTHSDGAALVDPLYKVERVFLRIIFLDDPVSGRW